MSHTEALANKLSLQLKNQQLKLAVAESCTGGSLAAILTSLSGSSAWFDCGFVTYSNQAKQQMLGVSESILNSDGAVSEATACAMASGALKYSHADFSVAITGIAGPTGGTDTKPVGTVWIAWAESKQPVIATCYTFSGNRDAVRKAAVIEALQGLIKHTA
jgi:nicotinamide-nucleotide amidase